MSYTNIFLWYISYKSDKHCIHIHCRKCVYDHIILKQYEMLSVLIVCVCALMFNMSSLVALAKSSDLKKSKFKRLVLNLSISDIVLLLEIILFRLFQEFENGSRSFNVACMVVIKFTGGTYLFSLYQCFLICVERLNATFITNKFGIQHLTSNRGIMFAFIAFHLKSVIHIIGEVSFITRETFQCNIVESSDIVGLILTSIPAALLCIVIVIFYGIVLVRIKKKLSNHPSQSEFENNNIAVQMKLKSFKTLSIVIFLCLVANMPRAFMLVYSLCTTSSEATLLWFKYCNFLVMLNPLFDPVIYVFCLADFRKQIKRLICWKKNSVRPHNQERIHT